MKKPAILALGGTPQQAESVTFAATRRGVSWGFVRDRQQSAAAGASLAPRSKQGLALTSRQGAKTGRMSFWGNRPPGCAGHSVEHAG